MQLRVGVVRAPECTESPTSWHTGRAQPSPLTGILLRTLLTGASTGSEIASVRLPLVHFFQRCFHPLGVPRLDLIFHLLFQYLTPIELFGDNGLDIVI